ncbi:hypothetical protein AB1N83_000678, partial [Pleurotus pulmonarius]
MSGRHYHSSLLRWNVFELGSSEFLISRAEMEVTTILDILDGLKHTVCHTIQSSCHVDGSSPVWEFMSGNTRRGDGPRRCWGIQSGAMSRYQRRCCVGGSPALHGKMLGEASLPTGDVHNFPRLNHGDRLEPVVDLGTI